LESGQRVRWIRHPVLRRGPVLQLVGKLSLLTFFTAFTTNLIDFYFKTYADQQFHGDVAYLTQFFGNFYLLVGCTSLATQLLVTPVIVRRASVFGGLALMPAALSACTGLNMLGATLIRATLLKLFDSGFSHSVYRSCSEMLYTRLPPNLTGEVKLVSEGVAGRAGLMMSGLVLFLLAPVLTTRRTLALIAVLLGCWLAALLLVRRSYQATGAPLGETGSNGSPDTRHAA
jgi:ATP/ADP translocase